MVQQLIHHTECMGPAVGSCSVGLSSIYSEALQRGEGEGEGEGEDTILPSYSRFTSTDSSSGSSGTLKKQFTSFPSIAPNQDDASVLTFYTCLIRLLACCATNPATPSGPKEKHYCSEQPQVYEPGNPTESYSANRQKQSMISRTRSILQNLVRAEDIVAILSFKSFDGRDTGLSPFHKEAALLFFCRVYGIPGPEMLLQLLTNAFIPDIKLALQLSQVQKTC